MWGGLWGRRRALGMGKGAESAGCPVLWTWPSGSPCCLLLQPGPCTGCSAICGAPLGKAKSWSRESQTESEEWINLHLCSFLLRGLCTIGFPIKADAGRSVPVTVLSPQGTGIALSKSLITSAISSEKMQSVFSSAESKIGAFLKLKAYNLRRVY